MPNPTPPLRDRLAPWPHWILPALTAAVILGAAVWPLDISPGRALRGLGSVELLQFSILDPVRNIVLFLPLGLVWPGSTRESIKRLLVASALLSLTIEVIQIVLPGRIVSVQDVLANTAGGGAGLALRVAGLRAARWWNRVPPVGALLSAAVAWAVTLLLVNALDHGIRQLRWPADHDLVVGNRDTRGRPWCVRVEGFRLQIGDETVRDPGWTALDDDPCPDAQRRTAPLPPGAAEKVARGVPVTFTLTATPERTDRWGPARILEIARPRSREEGSLMIAQERADLEVRVRRPLAGEEGRRPYYHIPDAFSPGKPTEISVHLSPDSVAVRAGATTLVHEPRLSSEWWMLFDRRVRWRPRRWPNDLAEALFWIVVTAPAALALGLSRSLAVRSWIGVLACGAFWLVSRTPGVLPPSVVAGTAALVLPPVFLCIWFGLASLLTLGVVPGLTAGSERRPPHAGTHRTSHPPAGGVSVHPHTRQAD